MKKYECCPVCNAKPSFSLPFSIRTKGNGKIMDTSIDELLVKVTKQSNPTGEISCCMNCRLVYNSKFYTSEELDKVYGQAYYLLEERIRGVDEFIYENEEFLKQYSKRIYNMVKGVENKYDQKINQIYDIGGRDGFMLKNLAEDGYQCTVVDPIARESCSSKVKKIDDWSSQVECTDGVDLVLFCDVLAHCINLREEICHLKKVLKDDGLLYVEVPYDIGTVIVWMLFKRWIGKNLLVDITHFTYFSKRSLVRLLEENGFECLSFNYDSIPGAEGVTVLTMLAKKTNIKRKSRYKSSSFCFDIFATGFIPKEFVSFFKRFCRFMCHKTSVR